jgi:hypothetical protein
MTHLRLKPYGDERTRWPDRGRVILAQYDADSIVVYQAYPPEIAAYAVEHGRLGGPGFSFARMSWIKSSFLWMMHRSEWASKPGQRAVLAIWLNRAVFDHMLSEAVPSRHVPGIYPTQEDWQAAVAASDVRLQWDPDYPPYGPKLARRAVQIGLRGNTLHKFATEWIIQVEDITGFVQQQAVFAAEPDMLLVPAQRVYPVEPSVALRLRLDKWTPG